MRNSHSRRLLDFEGRLKFIYVFFFFFADFLTLLIMVEKILYLFRWRARSASRSNPPLFNTICDHFCFRIEQQEIPWTRCLCIIYTVNALFFDAVNWISTGADWPAPVSILYCLPILLSSLKRITKNWLLAYHMIDMI